MKVPCCRALWSFSHLLTSMCDSRDEWDKIQVLVCVLAHTVPEVLVLCITTGSSQLCTGDSSYYAVWPCSTVLCRHSVLLPSDSKLCFSVTACLTPVSGWIWGGLISTIHIESILIKWTQITFNSDTESH